MLQDDTLGCCRHLLLLVLLPKITSRMSVTPEITFVTRWMLTGWVQPVLSLLCCTKKSPPLLIAHSPISTRAIKPGSLAAPARRNHLLVTDCCVFNEPEENKEREGCGATRVCCSVCQTHANSDNSQMFGCSFVKEIYGRCRAQKFAETRRWQRGQRFPGPGAPSLPPVCLPLAGVDGNGWTNNSKSALWSLGGLTKAPGSSFSSPGAL